MFQEKQLPMRIRGAIETGIFGGIGLGVGIPLDHALLPVWAEPLQGHISDFFGPAAYVGLSRFMSGETKGNSSLRAQLLYGIIGCSVVEVGQHFFPLLGTYDPKDFLAYIAGGSLIVLNNTLFPRRRNS